MKRILLADDEANLRLLVRTTLSDPRYELLEASDGHQAMQLAVTEHPDLIVLDWMMPGMSGIEVARMLRQDPLTAGTPIVMLTARGREQDRNQGTEVGAWAYLIKPFSPLELLDVVDRILGSEAA